MSNRNRPKKQEKVDTYICNPCLNRKCDARFEEGWCGVECFCTRSKDFAADPFHPLTEDEFSAEYDRRHGFGLGCE